MYLPIFAHPRLERDGTVTYVLCDPGCFLPENGYDLMWHAENGWLWKRDAERLNDGSKVKVPPVAGDDA